MKGSVSVSVQTTCFFHNCSNLGYNNSSRIVIFAEVAFAICQFSLLSSHETLVGENGALHSVEFIADSNIGNQPYPRLNYEDFCKPSDKCLLHQGKRMKWLRW